MSFRRLVSRLIYCMVFTITFSPIVSAEGFKPYEVKAVYLFRIANFIQWHDESSMDSVQFCVMGNQKVADTLISITNGKSIRSLPIGVQQNISPECNIAYLSDVERGSIETELNSNDISPNMVTISDTLNFTELGGVIELTRIDNKIKPKINLTNAKRGNYIIGSNLLRISIVEGK